MEEKVSTREFRKKLRESLDCVRINQVPVIITNYKKPTAVVITPQDYELLKKAKAKKLLKEVNNDSKG